MNVDAKNAAAEAVKLEGFASKDLYQRRERIFTRFVGGFYQRLQFFTGWPLLIGYFALPWVNESQQQAVLFDLTARQFHLFTLTFFPQDLWLLGWLLIIAAFALFTVTTVVGRLWCGFTCPQTVWTAIFMWMEQVAEGPRHRRMRLDKAPWTFGKLRKRITKHGMWLSWAALTGLTFVGYFTPIRALVTDLLQFQASGWLVFWGVCFSAATYVNAGWLREQVCIYMCPYARFQAAMFDNDTLVVSYDAARGEPRGATKRNAAARQHAAHLGNCINCELCVQVCPVGIDIRDGLQYQCIGCAHCIDACDEVMTKMDYPTGLVRYATERELSGGKTQWLRPRAVGYALVLLVMATAFGLAVFSRSALELDILRERGDLSQIDANNQSINQYRLKVLNKTQKNQRYTIRALSSAPISIRRSERLAGLLHSQAGESLDVPLTLTGPSFALSEPSVWVTIELCDVDTGQCDSEKTTFFGAMSP